MSQAVNSATLVVVLEKGVFNDKLCRYERVILNEAKQKRFQELSDELERLFNEE